MRLMWSLTAPTLSAVHTPARVPAVRCGCWGWLQPLADLTAQAPAQGQLCAASTQAGLLLCSPAHTCPLASAGGVRGSGLWVPRVSLVASGHKQLQPTASGLSLPHGTFTQPGHLVFICPNQS